MLDQVAAEQQTGLNVVLLDVAGDRVAIQTGLGADGDQEAEPGRTAVLSRLGQNDAVVKNKAKNCRLAAS